MKKRILCFGDSNTWGYAPNGERYDETIRWPMRMAAMLGDDYIVVEEGFNGRTTVLDDPSEGGYKSGANYLPPCLMTHNPLDLVILMLGTNDTKCRFGMSAFAISQGMTQLIKLTRIYAENRDKQPPRILLVSPVPNGDWIMETLMGPIFGGQSPEVSRDLADTYRKLALQEKIDYLDAGALAETSREDAIHLSPEGQIALANGIGAKVRAILEGK
ncbi:SGNH/GDSL hydrolase family protein [Eubacteriales bacterium OttesenSCG-928-N13]|nr:SGNH/GDSL hydrolase family protein [Eubacteriales bacterium OttesenSCG-928-N13]